MKVFASKFSNEKNNRNNVKKRELVNFSELAYVKINSDDLPLYNSSTATKGNIISCQKKIEASQVFCDNAGNVTHRPKKFKSLSLVKRSVQSTHKLKELRVVLKRLPEAWLRTKQIIISSINNNLLNCSKYTSRKIAVNPNYHSDANNDSCFEKQVGDSCGPVSTPDAVLCRGITVSSSIQTTEMKNSLLKFKTKYPEFLVKEMHVSLHKFSCNLQSYNWSQIEHVYHRCKYCPSIAVQNRFNQQTSSHQTTLNKCLIPLHTNKQWNILYENESTLKNNNVSVQRRSRKKWHFRCLFCSEDCNNHSADQKRLSKKSNGNELGRTITPLDLSEIDFSGDEMDYPDTSYISAKKSKQNIGSKKSIYNKDLRRMHSVSPMELIQAVNYAVHLALSEPWLQLDVPGPAECCESRHHRVFSHWMMPDVGMSELFRNAFSQGLWHPAFSLLHMMISAGAIPQPEDLQKILMFVMTTEEWLLKEEALTIIQMVFHLWPPCCLHTKSYYNAVFRSPHKVGSQESNGLLLSMVAVLRSQLSCQFVEASDSVIYSTSVIKIVVSALAADVASWLSRHQTKKRTGPKREVPLAQIALGQTADTQIHLCNVQNIVELCICDWMATSHHDVFMDLVRLVAEVFRTRYAVPLQEYPCLGTDCHLLASEIVSQIELSGMESESIGQFLCVLKPNWLAMLVGQKLLEKLQGPLRGSVIDTVTSYILEYRDFQNREVNYAEHCGDHKISLLDKNAKKVNKRDHKGEVQLHRSCRRGKINVVLKLLAVPGVDVNICDNAGWSPLHEAVSYSHVVCVQTLLNFIPPPGSPYVYTAARADCGTTPLISAAVAGDAEMCHILLQHSGIVLLEDVLEGNDIKLQLKEQIPEEIQSLLKTAKLKYENIIAKHLGVSLSEEIWSHMHHVFVPLVCSHMATYHVPLIRCQFGPAWRGTMQVPSTHVEYSTIHQIMKILRSFEKMRKVLKHLCKRHEIPISVSHQFQSYF